MDKSKADFLFNLIEKNQTKKIMELLNSGIDANIQDKYGNTPLMRAVRKNNIEIVKLLLDNGANIDLTDYNNSKAYDFALRRGLFEIAKLIKTNSELSLKYIGTDKLFEAIVSGDLENVKTLVEYANLFEMQEVQGIEFYFGNLDSDHDCWRYKDESKKSKTDEDNTTIKIRDYFPYPDLRKFVLEKNINEDIRKYIIEQLDEENIHIIHPILMKFSGGLGDTNEFYLDKEYVTDFLLNECYISDYDDSDFDSGSGWINFIKFDHKRYDESINKYLRKNNIEIPEEHLNYDSKPIKSKSTNNEEKKVEEKVNENESDIQISITGSYDKEECGFFIPEDRLPFNKKALHHNIRKGRDFNWEGEVTEYKGKQIRFIVNDYWLGDTEKEDYEVYKSGCQIYPYSESNYDFDGIKSAVKKLIRDNPEKINTLNDFGETFLHESILAGNIELVKLLINNGADVNMKNKDGITPLDIASEYEDICDLLIQNCGIKSDNAPAEETLETEQ